MGFNLNMLVSLKSVLNKAKEGHYAVPAFNINDLEFLQAIVEVAKKMKSPVIVQTSEGAIKYAGMENLANMAKTAAKEGVKIVFHLDHGKDFKIIKKALNAGYTSIMFDGSALPYEKNLRLTKQMVAAAHKKGISVEAELGALRGVEDLVSVSEREAILTNPKQAAEFVKKTGCDALAVAIGTSHGAYKFSAKGGSASGGKGHKLDFERLKKIKRVVKIPLVLHGASGVSPYLVNLINKCGGEIGCAKGNSDSEIKKAISLGVCKINIDTDLRLAFTAGVRCELKKDKKVFDPRQILGAAKEIMKKVIADKIKLCGSGGKI